MAGVASVVSRADSVRQTCSRALPGIGAFEPPQPVIDGQSNLYYFSFVTVTSLGYGDISPASDLTRILAPVEAIIGAIIVAALVGRIVGLLVAQTSENDTNTRLDALAEAVDRLGQQPPSTDQPGEPT